jgi:hypothetical protein
LNDLTGLVWPEDRNKKVSKFGFKEAQKLEPLFVVVGLSN